MDHESFHKDKSWKFSRTPFPQDIIINFLAFQIYGC